MENNENIEMCKTCGGVCCKHMGCHYSPKDFKNLSFDGLYTEIDKGHISIDWCDGDPREDEDLNNCELLERAPYLRIRNRKPIESECRDALEIIALALHGLLADNNNSVEPRLCPIVDPSFGGCPCSLLTPTGCSLSFEDRPLGGRALIPDIKNHCQYSSYEKRDCAIEWLQYNKILEDLIEKYMEE